MPFTVSHVVMAIPLRRFGLPFSAAAIGCVVPDLALFAPGVVRYERTHSMLGLLVFDVPAGLVLIGLWVLVLRPAVTDLAPDWVRAGLGPAPGLIALHRDWWLRSATAVLIGAASHLGWDAFTHRGGLGVALVPVLSSLWGPMVGYKWLQYLSGAAGLVVLAVWARHSLRRPQFDPPKALVRGNCDLANESSTASSGVLADEVSGAAHAPRHGTRGASAGREDTEARSRSWFPTRLVLAALPFLCAAVGAARTVTSGVGKVPVDQLAFQMLSSGVHAGAAGLAGSVLTWWLLHHMTGDLPSRQTAHRG